MDFDGFFNTRGARQQVSGVAIALVKSTKDPKGLGRIQINLPWRGKENEKYWARFATLTAGKNMGMVFYPEIDDEVLVAFEHGDIDRPYVIGALWNSKDKIPESNSDGKNNIKMIKTRSGHTIKIDDKDGSEKIEIIDKTEGNKICIDSSSNKITIECGGDIELSASKGKVSINAKEIEIKSASSSIKIESSAGMDLKATNGIMNIKGSTVNIN